MPTDYIPKANAALVVWFSNFAAKFAQDAETLGFTPADVDSVNNDYTMLVYMVNSVEAYKTASAERSAFLRVMYESPAGGAAPALPKAPNNPPPAVIVSPGILARTRLLVNRIKLSPAYSESTGRDFQVIGGGGPAPDPNARPSLTGRVNGGRVELRFVKGVYDGVTVQTQAVDSQEWVYLDKVTVAPCVDARPATPATAIRRYRAMYFKRNADIGQWSETVSVTLSV